MHAAGLILITTKMNFKIRLKSIIAIYQRIAGYFVRRPIIYDVGMCHGEDAKYYLSRGFRVLAIEANPILYRENILNFKYWIDQGLITILNVAISGNSGTANFYINNRANGHLCFSNREQEMALHII